MLRTVCAGSLRIILPIIHSYFASAMPHTELKNKILDRQQITETLGRNVYGGTSGNVILNISVFKRDLNESNVTADLVLRYILFQTVGAVKLLCK